MMAMLPSVAVLLCVVFVESVDVTFSGDRLYIPPFIGSMMNHPISPPKTKLPAMYHPLALATTGMVCGSYPSFEITTVYDFFPQ